MNIEQQVAILKLQLIKLEQETTGNNARLTIMENTSDDHDKEHTTIRLRLEILELLTRKMAESARAEPWATLDKEEAEEDKPVWTKQELEHAEDKVGRLSELFGFPPDKLCKYVNGKPSAHPWHLSSDLNEGAEYIRLDEKGKGFGFIMNPIEVSSLRNPDTLTKREFIKPSNRFIEAARGGQSLGLHAAYNIPNLTVKMVGTLDSQFIHTHLGLPPYSYYHDRNDGEMEQEWGKGGCGK